MRHIRPAAPVQRLHCAACLLKGSRALDGRASTTFFKPSPTGGPPEPLALTPPFTHTCKDSHHFLSSSSETSLPAGHPPTAAAPLPCQTKSLLRHPPVVLKDGRWQGSVHTAPADPRDQKNCKTARLECGLHSAPFQLIPHPPPTLPPPTNQFFCSCLPSLTSAPGKPRG